MLTKLEAVNEMLAAIGEDPVASLVSGLGDAESAETMLDRWSKKIQARGWACNIETFSITPDNNNEILLSDSILRIDTVGRDEQIDVSVRKNNGQRKLYKKDTQSFTFTSSLRVETVTFLDFESLTYELQNYIVARATQAYQTAEMGSVALDTFIERDEQEAWAALSDAEAEAEDLNMIYSNNQGYRAAYRYSPTWR